MFEQYENDFNFPVKLRSGGVMYFVDQEDADRAKAAIKNGIAIPAPRNRRVLPFGQGIVQEGERIEVYYRDVHLGTFRDLKLALKEWDITERYERFCEERDAQQAALDARYYSELTYDEDGYKIYKPRPSSEQNLH